MKNLGSFGTHLANETALDPIQYVTIEWPNMGTVTYSERKPTDDSTFSPTLVGKFAFSSTKKTDSLGEVRQATVTLFDFDNSLREEFENFKIERAVCRLGFTYYGATDSELTELLFGKIQGPITWNEAKRELTFDVVTAPDQIDYQEILTNPTLEASPYSSMANLATDLVDKVVPKVFGAVEHMPAMRITRRLQAVLTEPITINHPDVDSPTVPNTTQFKLKPAAGDRVLFEGMNLTSILETSGFKINLEGVVISCSWSGAYDPTTDEYTFIIDSNFDAGLNAIKYRVSDAGLEWGDRDEDDDDYDNPKVAWLNKDGYNIANNVVRVNGQYQQFNRCVRQRGRKCWFENPWCLRTQVLDQPDIRTPFPIEPTDEIERISCFKQQGSLSNYLDGSQDDVLQFREGTVVEPWWTGLSYLGTTYYTATYPDIYLIRDKAYTSANQVSSVKAFNSVYSDLVEIPYTSSSSKTRYRLDQNWEGTGYTALIFPVPLTEYPNEGWNDNVFVTQRSSIGDSWVDGTTDPNHNWGNPSGIIKWLVETYASSYTIDSTTFNTARTATENYPHGFALDRKIEFFTLLSDIAWQSGLALIVDGSTIKLKQLTDDVESSYSITDTLILERTLNMELPDSIDLITEFRYSFLRRGNEQPIQKYIALNTEEIGENTKSYNFYTINKEEVADVIAEFWSNRLGQLWRRINLKLPLESVGLEPFDQVDLDLTGAIGRNTSLYPTLNTAEAEVIEAVYSPNDYSVVVALELPYVVGSTTKDTDYWSLSTIAQPQNPASINKKQYSRLEIKDELIEHSANDHRDINLTRRFEENGTISSFDHSRKSIAHRDALLWDSISKEFVPGSVSDLLEEQGWNPGGGGDTVYKVYNMGIWQR